MKNASVDILLASFNGSAFIADQLDSLLNQNQQNIHLIIRDDLSTDGTSQILKSYTKKHPEKITLLSSEKRLGVKNNFSCLMNHSKATYIMFADQDDVWEIDKVRQALEKMMELERESLIDTPLLIHTDLKVADKNLKIISPSFWQYSGINPFQAGTFNRLLMQNVVTGCTMMINRPLLELASPIPEDCAMHDWWLALVASAFGKIEATPQTTMFYRQHGKNALGAQKFLSVDYLKKGLEKIRRPEFFKQAHAHELLIRYPKFLNENQKKMLKAFQKLPDASFLEKLLLIFKYKFYKSGLLRNIVNIFFKKQ